MFPEQLQKILNLIKQTGDRVIVFDGSKPDDSYVIMDLDSYSHQVGAAVKTVVKAQTIIEPQAPIINPSVSPEKSPEISLVEPELPVVSVKIQNLTEEDLTDKINREISVWKNREDVSYLGEENKVKKAWTIPPQVRNKAQEVKN
jgi:hypothetical protein